MSIKVEKRSVHTSHWKAIISSNIISDISRITINVRIEEITSKEIPSGKKWKPSYQARHHCSSQETYWNTRIEENLKKQKNQEPLMSWVC